MPTLPLRQPSLERPSEHALLCNRDGVFHSNQPQSHLWMSSFSGDISQPLPERYNPGPIGRCSMPVQVSPAGSVNGPTNTMVLDAEDGRFGHISPPAFATRKYSSIEDTGYPLNPAYRPHSHPYPHPNPHHPVLTTSPSILMFPCQFGAGYHGHNLHDIQISPQVPTGLGLPYPSSEPPYHAHHRPPAPAPAAQLLLPQSTGLCMHTPCQPCPVPAVAATQTSTSFPSQPPVFGSSHCNSSVSASYNEMEAYGVPPSEPDPIHWNSPPTPPTRSGLPVTPPDHTVAPQLPPSFHLQPPKSPRPHYVPASMLPFTPTLTGPAFPTGNEEQFIDTPASLKSKLSLNEGAKDVFQSLKRKRLPLAASFSRPKPRALPVKKVLPKIHGCPTCGKMFDRPSTLLVHQASHTKAKDYACNKCRKTFSVNSNMRRHWRNCTETPRDYSIPSSPSVPIKQEVPSSSPLEPEPSEPFFTDSPPMAGPSGPPLNPRSLSETTRQQTLSSSVPPTMVPPSEVLPPKMTIQPRSLRRRFAVVSQPDIAAPAPPVRPRMTKAQEEEMRGWFPREIWSNVMECLKRWRFCGTFWIRTTTTNSPAVIAKLLDKMDFRGVVRAKTRWGEERDSWSNIGYAPYWGAQWIGVLPGPAPGDLQTVPMGIGDDEESAGDVPCAM